VEKIATPKAKAVKKINSVIRCIDDRKIKPIELRKKNSCRNYIRSKKSYCKCFSVTSFLVR